MPNIKVQDAPQLGLSPSETGIEATALAARRANVAFNQAGAAVEKVGDEFGRNLGSAVRDAGNVAVQYAEHREISHGAAAFAQLNDDLTQQWNNTAKSADPNDPTVAQKFREGVLEPTLEKYRDSFLTEGGQKFAEARVDSLRDHMFTKTAADMSSLASDAVAVNVRQTANSLSNTAMSDPSSVQHLLDSADSLVGGMVSSAPNLKGADSARTRMQLTEKMKESIVKAGAVGAIQNSNDPEGEAARWGAKYPDYINGAELKQLGAYAKSQQRANLLTEKQLQQYQKQQAADAAHTALSKNFTDSITFDDNGKATVKPEFYKNIMAIEQKFPGAATERAKAMINFGQSEQREKRETIITDGPTRSALYDGLFSTDKPTTDVDILKASAEHKLDPHDTTTLIALNKALEDKPLKGPIFQGTMASVKGIYGEGEKGHEAYAKFLQTFIPEYLRQERAGTLPPNALDLRDENSLLSKAVAPFRLSPQDKMRDVILKRFGMGGDMGGGDMTTILNPEAKPASKPAAVTTKADYDSLPSGSVFTGQDGKRYRKP